MREYSGNYALLYFYDLSGIAGFEYIPNGKVNPNATPQLYHFQKNIQGDITHILDNNGNVVVKYYYDAWGKCLTLNPNGTLNSSDAFIGNINPFRYRGYYYDVETGLFLLGSRYYDPEVGRFISADDIDYALLQSDMINGLNLYSYCMNNPISYTDPSGHSILLTLLIGFAIGAAIGGGFEIAGQISSNGWNPGNWDWKQIGLSTLGGGVAGLLTAIPAGWVLTPLLWGTAAVANSVISGTVNVWDGISGKEWGQLGLTFGIGAASGALFKGLSSKIGAKAINKIQSNITKYADDVIMVGAQGAFKPTFAQAADAISTKMSTKILLMLANKSGNLGGMMLSKANQMLWLLGINSIFG